MLLEMRQKKPSTADPMATAPTRGRRIVNQTRLERLHNHADARSVMEKRHSLVSENELELQRRRISALERWSIRQLDHQMEQVREKEAQSISWVPPSRITLMAYLNRMSAATSRKSREPDSILRLSSRSSDGLSSRRSMSLSRYSFDSLKRLSPIATPEMKGTLL